MTIAFRIKKQQDTNPMAILLVLLFAVGCFTPSHCCALDPHEVLVVANRNAAKSMGLAKYYMKKRKIPKKNFIALWVTDDEHCRYKTYKNRIAKPIRRYIENEAHGNDIRCLLLMYGVPMKISGHETTEEEEIEIIELKNRKSDLIREMVAMKEKGESNDHLNIQIDSIDRRLKKIGTPKNKDASVDSELSFVMAENYSFSGWLPNPFYTGRSKKTFSIEKADTMMVSRLDGPTDEVVRRIIDDSLFAERDGLKGTCYLDARWKVAREDKDAGYVFYDQSIHKLSKFIIKNNFMPVSIETTRRLFQPGECPEAALYCGWYSLARYIDAFEWRRGAVGFHIASSECKTLKRPGSQVWCKRMLEEGVAATIGPVGEPYVQGFPVPEVFFGYLLDGYLTLVECYYISLPYLSWRMVLIGDPLYRPFMNRHKR